MDSHRKRSTLHRLSLACPINDSHEGRFRRGRGDWVLVVMDHWTRRIVGFAVHRSVDGVALCRCSITRRMAKFSPTYLRADGPTIAGRFHQWQANLRILNVRENQDSALRAPRSHPVIERLIGTVRRECLDRLLFWTAADLAAEAGPVPAGHQTSILHACGAGRVPAGSEPGPSRRSGDFPGRIGGSRTVAGLYHTPRAA